MGGDEGPGRGAGGIGKSSGGEWAHLNRGRAHQATRRGTVVMGYVKMRQEKRNQEMLTLESWR